ncbi:MAG: tetratricopeptide repeat protein [Chloroflexi bacterium]|nr:tetratricopeptide repeat protein [Chloroflexota bacterium]
MEPAELRARRRALGLSQAELAATLGVAGNTVARWERGASRIGNPALVLLALERRERTVQSSRGAPSTVHSRRRRASDLTQRALAHEVRHNLPPERTSLVGREQELTDIRKAVLDSEGRLVTLTGAGGAGKSRLALRVGADVVPRFGDGVWLVELAPLVNPTRVPQAVAAVLGIRERPGRPLVQTLVTSLSACRMLLVLDNCEHLSAACRELAEALLEGCPGLRILATGRAPLRVMGEVVWRVPPLTLPAACQVGSIDDLSTCSSVQLFVERARAARSDFVLTTSNAETISEICRLLDGLPLAEELAAAWVRVLGVQQIRERLSQCLLLADETPQRAQRHRTLQATLDWSYTLLNEPERIVFRRLAVFAGGWTLEAAGAVCTSSRISFSAVLDLLTRLVDQSLVVTDEDGQRARYRLLEPVRQYAQQCLLASGEAGRLSRRHACYFQELAERLDSQRVGFHTRALDDQRQVELANFRAALGWAVGSGQAEVGLLLAAALRTFWSARGLLTESRDWFARLLNSPHGARRTRSRARALCAAGHNAYYQGDHSTAVQLLTESVAIWRELNESAGLADALDELGLVDWARADFVSARTVLTESLGLARTLGLRHLEGRGEYHLGLVAYEQGDFAAAQESHTRSLAVARELQDPLAQARAFFGLGQVAHQRGDLSLARSLHERGLAGRRAVGESWGMALALVGLGHVYLDEGDSIAARGVFAESLSLSRELGDRHGLARSLEGLAALSAEQGQHERAVRLAEGASTLRVMGAAPRSPTESILLERRLTGARRALGQRGSAALSTESCGWSTEDLLAFALDDVAGGQSNSAAPRGQPLTRREHEVAALVARGLSNRQIAADLVIAERTVASHVEHIMGKLGFNSRTRIGVWAAAHSVESSTARPST